MTTPIGEIMRPKGVRKIKLPANVFGWGDAEGVLEGSGEIGFVFEATTESDFLNVQFWMGVQQLTCFLHAQSHEIGLRLLLDNGREATPQELAELMNSSAVLATSGGVI